MNSSVIIVLSVCLIIIGAMVLDPAAALACFVLSVVLSLLTAVRGRGRIRYISAIVLVVGLVSAFSKAPDAVTHYGRYSEAKKGVTR